MDQELTPGEVAARRFRQAFRGFDPDEVIDFLAGVAQQIEQMTAQRDRLAGRLGEFAERDLKSEFEAIGDEVSGVLEAARAAAEAMRERAATDAARWRAEAMAEADSERKAARADAEHLRTDAWTTAEDLIRQSQAEARRIKESAERDSMTILGESEREAHRLTAGARREAEDLMRITRMEAEKISAEAKSRHDDIIEQARKQAETAQERARALEQRRQELLGELETLRATLSRMEGELDERRSRLGLSAAAEAEEEAKTPLRVVRPEETGAAEGEWVPGETVRVVPSRRKATEVPPLGGDELVDEVRRLRKESSPPPVPMAEEPEPTPNAPEEPSPPEPSPQEPSPQMPSPQMPSPAEVVASVEPELEPPAPEPATPAPPLAAAGGRDEVTDIFRRLRGGEPDEPDQPGEVVPEPPASVSTPAPEEPAPAPRPARTVKTKVDPFDLRERLLLPVSNRALRSMKRQLTELQNLALEEVRVSEGSWRPTEALFVEQLRPDVTVLMSEAFAMGHNAAEEMVGQNIPRPATPAGDEASALVRALLQQLSTVLDAGGEEGSRELSGSVSRVFRVWRTDEAERKVADLASSAYNHGMQASLEAVGEEIGFVISGRGCSRCREAAEDGGEAMPPLHPGCGCTLAPTSG